MKTDLNSIEKKPLAANAVGKIVRRKDVERVQMIVGYSWDTLNGGVYFLAGETEPIDWNRLEKFYDF